MTWDEFNHDNEPDVREQWQCPCPECNGAGGVRFDIEEDDPFLNEPSAEAITPSEWVWAE
jgi:hypothetical protein